MAWGSLSETTRDRCSVCLKQLIIPGQLDVGEKLLFNLAPGEDLKLCFIYMKVDTEDII